MKSLMKPWILMMKKVTWSVKVSIKNNKGQRETLPFLLNKMLKESGDGMEINARQIEKFGIDFSDSADSAFTFEQMEQIYEGLVENLMSAITLTLALHLSR